MATIIIKGKSKDENDKSSKKEYEIYGKMMIGYR